MGVNNLPKVVAQQCPSGSRTRDLSIASPTCYPECHCVTQRHYVTQRAKVLSSKCKTPVVKCFNMLSVSKKTTDTQRKRNEQQKRTLDVFELPYEMQTVCQFITRNSSGDEISKRDIALFCYPSSV